MRRREFLQLAASAPLAAAVSKRRANKAWHVVVAGGGFAGAACASALRRIDPAIDVTLIDPDDRYITCPMSNAVIAGWRSLDSITVGRKGLTRAGVRFVRDRVASVDVEGRRVLLGKQDPIAYDRLVVAPGIRLLWNTPQGYDEAAAQRFPHAWIAGAQTTLLAAQIRAMPMGGVIAITVPAGLMRCPPGPFERASVIAAYLKQHNPRAKILIHDSNNHFPKQDVFMAAWNELYPGMIEWLPPSEGGVVERLNVDNASLYTSRGVQPVDVANIIPAQAPGQLAVDAGLCSGHGWCPVDTETFESTHVKNVHVIGDACIADAMPKSASSAYSQALQCASAISALLTENAVSTAQFASVCYGAIARDRAISIHGAFHVVEGKIAAVDPPISEKISQQREAELAERWYDDIVSRAFSANRSSS